MRKKDYGCPRDVACSIGGNRGNVCDRVVRYVSGEFLASVNGGALTARCAYSTFLNNINVADISARAQVSDSGDLGTELKGDKK